MPRTVRLIRYLSSTATLCLGLALPAAGQLVINEIHYDPDVKTEAAEFIEVFNAGADSADLGAWRLDGGVSYSIPEGTMLAGGGYLVIAQDPTTMMRKFGVSALGPWIGRLDNSGAKVELLDAAGQMEDKVEYGAGFPWPTVGDSPGYSIELINPSFDNNLGGNWRRSVVGAGSAQDITLIQAGSSWRYFPGTTEASSPTSAWRQPGFDDSSWAVGATPIGYDPSQQMGTYLGDMRYNYTTVFLRKSFVVESVAAIRELAIEALCDDGFKIWVNGHAIRDGAFNMSAGEVPFDGTAGVAIEDNSYNEYTLDGAANFLVPGTNVLAIQAANASRGNSSDFFWDVTLLARVGPPLHGPTPSQVNSVFATNAPPQIRQVDHSPSEPASGQPVTITAKITDPEGLGAVSLLYQVVDPGNYIEIGDAAYTNNWVSVPMNDAGLDGDAAAGDDIFTARLPAEIQQNRRLIRYRISAADRAGANVRVPYPDDPQPNFAYFVYDGVPAWQAAVRPGVTPVLTFDTNAMRHLPPVQLIAKRDAVENATWFSRYGGDTYLWTGTLVFDGKVYDHIHYRARGGVWRYSMVKNMWKFDFNRGHELLMRDNYGEKYRVTWKKLNLGACIQQGNYDHRGEQGMFESVGFRLFNLVGAEAPETAFVQLRIVDDAQEAPPGQQYEGDFWGLYLAVEQEDGRFLDQHDLPDGNLYKMESGSGELNNLGPNGPTDKSDLNSFLTYTSKNLPEDWWRANLDLNRYYGYRTIIEGIHHYDVDEGAGKNYFYYLNPESDIWSVHPWDLDLTWAANMYGGGNEPFKNRVLPQLDFNLEFKNRAREIRDLLFNPDQAGELIDEYAWLLRGPTNGPTFLDADRCKWDYNPKMANPSYSSSLNKAGQGRFYQWPNEPTVSKDFNGCIQLMKNYVEVRMSVLDSLDVDGSIPSKPTLSYLGPANYPLNRLQFRCSPYSGAYPLKAMQWRAAEVTDPAAPAFQPGSSHHYEITASWESGEIEGFSSDETIPAGALKVGHAYRVRVKVGDTSGRWSHWSDPVQFAAGVPDNAAALSDNLRLSELMYNPPDGGDYEFIELHNASDSLSLELDGARFTAGVDFAFPTGTILPPGGYLLVVKAADFNDFRAHYELSNSVPIVGPYTGSLANEGERLTLKAGANGAELMDFSYGTGGGWPLAAQVAGHSIVPVDVARGNQATGALDYPGNWRASAFIGGSPGFADPIPIKPLALNELAANTESANPSDPEHPSNDWIELFNTTDSGVDLNYWYLSDDPSDIRKWAIPAMILGPHSWVSFDETTGLGFGLSREGEQVLLSYLPGNGEDRVVDSVRFKAQERGVTLGRFPDGAGPWFAMAPTRGAQNGPGLHGIVINELMYHPPDQATNGNTMLEYVELLNPTASEIPLGGTNGPWRLDGGMGFTFPTNTTLGPGGVLLVLNIDPSDSLALKQFRAAYGLTNAATVFLGPYSGKLSNRSDRVALEKPLSGGDPAAPNGWALVDEVIYGNQAPWPDDANGGGASLQRISPSGSGDDPANWISGDASPGAASALNSDRDGDGLPDYWEEQYGLNPENPADAALDSDGDGMTNAAEFVAGTNPRDPASALRLDALTESEGQVLLSFTALAGHSYTVQFSSAPGDADWRTLADEPASSETHSVRISDAIEPAAAARFYRLATPALP